jgi:hypothetical protein
MTNRTIVLSAVVIAALAWIDPIFVPLVLLGPLVSGVVAGRRGVAPRQMAAVWFLAGLLMLVSDLVINNEDVAFHAVVAVVTAALAAGATALGSRRGATAADHGRAERDTGLVLRRG